jgi:hypothetical protein
MFKDYDDGIKDRINRQYSELDAFMVSANPKKN